MATTQTMKFKDIFSNHDEFIEFCKEINLIEINISITDPIITYINFVFNTLLWSYGTVDIAYDTKQEFLMELALLLTDTFNQYRKQYDLISKIYLFDDDEFARTSANIISNAQQNNKKLDDPSVWLGFVASQTFNEQKLSKFQGYTQAIRQMPSYDRLLFRDKYRYLFQTIFVTDYYYTNKGGK